METIKKTLLAVLMWSILLSIITVCTSTAKAEVTMHIIKDHDLPTQIIDCKSRGECYRMWLQAELRGMVAWYEEIKSVLILENGVKVWERHYH